MSAAQKVDVLAVIGDAMAKAGAAGEGKPGTGTESEEFKNLQAVYRAVFELTTFVRNIATPMSEPLNSAVACKTKEQRRHWMGVIRSDARAALARIGGES